MGVVPFFVFALAFLLLPAAWLVIGSFQDAEGRFTFDNITGLARVDDPGPVAVAL